MPEDRRQFEIIQDRFELLSHVLDLQQCLRLFYVLCMFLNGSYILLCSYIREKEMEEELLKQRREEEGRGKERRKALLEKEERKWKEIEASLISSIPNAGSREAAAMAAAVRAVGGDSVLDDSFARERVSNIARRIRSTQLSRRALQVCLTFQILIFVLSFWVSKIVYTMLDSLTYMSASLACYCLHFQGSSIVAMVA